MLSCFDGHPLVCVGITLVPVYVNACTPRLIPCAALFSQHSKLCCAVEHLLPVCFFRAKCAYTVYNIFLFRSISFSLSMKLLACVNLLDTHKTYYSRFLPPCFAYQRSTLSDWIFSLISYSVRLSLLRACLCLFIDGSYHTHTEMYFWCFLCEGPGTFRSKVKKHWSVRGRTWVTSSWTTGLCKLRSSRSRKL